MTPTDRTTASNAEFVARFAPFDPMASVLPVTAWLQQLDELRAAATPGPWEPWTGSYGGVGASTPDGDIVLDYSTWVDNPEDHRQAQALTALIVAAVNNLPQLTAAIRAVLELADELDQPDTEPGEADTFQNGMAAGEEIALRYAARRIRAAIGSVTT